MFEDQYGYALTTSSAEAAEAFVRATDALAEGAPGAWDDMAAVAALDPDFALGQLLAYAAVAMAGDPRGNPEALARARDVAAGATEREQSLVAIAAGPLDPGSDPIGRAEAHVRRWPRDFIGFVLLSRATAFVGAPPEQVCAIYLEAASAWPADEWALTGQLGFMLSEIGRAEEARSLGDRAFTLNPRSANAVHALTHVDHEAGQFADGRERLREWLAGYDPRGRSWSHLTWHQALFDLGLGERERALARLGDSMMPAAAADLLWRITMTGGTVEDVLWTIPVNGMRQMLAMATSAGAGIPPHVVPSAAIAAAGGKSPELTAELAAYVDGLDAAAPLTEGLRATVDGFLAMGRDDFNAAVACLEAGSPIWPRMGASRVEQEVFALTLAAARREGAPANLR